MDSSREMTWRQPAALFFSLWVTACSSQSEVINQTGSKQTWVSFITPFEQGFIAQKIHLTKIANTLEHETIYKLNPGDSNLMVRWQADSEPVVAPEHLNSLISEFKVLNLHGAAVKGGLVQMAFYAFSPSFNGISLFATIDYTKAKNLGPICDSTTIEREVSGGRCWWPLPEDGWYMDFIWAEHDEN